MIPNQYPHFGGFPEYDFRRPCPPWCVECGREHDVEAGFVVHQGASQVVTHCGESARPALLTVRASHLDKLPEAMRTPPTDMHRPLVEVSFAVDDLEEDDLLQFTPAQARDLAAVLAATADLIDPPAGPPEPS